jgi:integral membrane protein
LLILGIILRDVVWVGNPYTVAIAGTIHGGLFMLYIVAVLLVAPSLRWPLPVTIIAGLCSVPPYGSVAFERVVALHRRYRDARILFRSTLIGRF